MSRTLELAGWVLAVGAIAAAAFARHRMASLAEAVARTCHELRGPLTAARLGLVVAFRTGQVADVRLRALELDLGRATLAVEDLSQVSSTRRRQAAIGGEAVDVVRLLIEAVEAWQAMASAYGAELRLAHSPERPVVMGDRLRLAQAVGNLVANAAEHGGGVVELGCRADAGVVRIEVADEGAGLPAPVRQLVRRRRRGTGRARGHGLAIASSIAHAHGGRLDAVPSERGARVVLEVPRLSR